MVRALAHRKGTEPRSAHLNKLVGALFLTVGEKEFGYWLDPLSHDLGPAIRAFRLTKFVSERKAGEPDHYDVTVDATHQGGTCECKGFLRWNHCKHTSSLLALIQSNRL